MQRHLRAVVTTTALALVALIVIATPATATAQPILDIKPRNNITNPGWLYLDRYLPDKKAEARGLVRPALFVYRVDDAQKTGARIGSGGYDAGDPIPLEEGWYDVELAHFPDMDPTNKHRYYVRAGQVTIVQSGMVSLQTLPESDQAADMCRTWNSQMNILSRTAGTDGHTHAVLMAGNGAGVKEHGMLQLHPGAYLVEWNGLIGEVQVEAGMITPIQTGFVGPFRDREKPRIHQREGDAADNPVITACEKQPTQVLVGSFWLSYSEAAPASDEDDPDDLGIVSMAKAKRVFAPLVVDPFRPAKPERLSGDKLKGYTIYKGDGSAPSGAR